MFHDDGDDYAVLLLTHLFSKCVDAYAREFGSNVCNDDVWCARNTYVFEIQKDYTVFWTGECVSHAHTHTYVYV